MAIATPDVDKDCFANVDELDPDTDKCAACAIQKMCEQEIITRAEEADAAREEMEADMFSHGLNSARRFREKVSHLRPAKMPPTSSTTTSTPSSVSYSTPTPNYIPSPTSSVSCPGVSPVQAAPRLEGESVWSRLVKNVTLGSLARALTEGVLLAEDERRRPVGSGRPKR